MLTSHTRTRTPCPYYFSAFSLILGGRTFGLNVFRSDALRVLAQIRVGCICALEQLQVRSVRTVAQLSEGPNIKKTTCKMSA